MSDPGSDRPPLTRDEEAFVRRLASSYAAPELSPRERTAFHAGLDERMARRRAFERWRPLLAGAAVATVLAVLVLARAATLAPPSTDDRPAAVASSATAENVILALVDETANGGESELPDDYLAIEDVFLGE